MGKFLLVVIIFAALVYGFFWLLEKRRAGGPGTPRSRRPEPRSTAPDDDEDFLRDLNRRKPRRDQDQ